MTLLPGFAAPKCGRSEVDGARSPDLLTPARCSFRISAVCRAAVVAGLSPNLWPFCLAWARPARVRSRRISLSRIQRILPAGLPILECRFCMAEDESFSASEQIQYFPESITRLWASPAAPTSRGNSKASHSEGFCFSSSECFCNSVR